MPQAIYRPSSTAADLPLIDFQMEILPISLPPAISDTTITFPGSAQSQLLDSLPILRLIPGEYNELGIRVKNPGQRSLVIQLALDSHYPAGWCICGYESEIELPPGTYQDLAIAFKVHSNYFEMDARFHCDPIYTCQLSARALDNGIQRLARGSLFNLQIRPRTTYLDFLPAVYSELDFFGRLLSIFEQSFDPYLQTLDTLWAYLDPLTAPQSLLPFLAHWVGWELEPDLDLAVQRQLIRHAIEIYRLRGTRAGLHLCLRLYTGLPSERIQIQTHHGRGMALGQSQLGNEETAALGGGHPFHFTVRLTPNADDPIYDRDLITRVIEREKPSFCTYTLQSKCARFDIVSFSHFQMSNVVSMSRSQPKPGEIWEVRRSFDNALSLAPSEQQLLYSKPAQDFFQGKSSARFVMIVRELELSSSEAELELAIMVCSSEIEFVSQFDILIPDQLSTLGQDLLAETWHVLPMLQRNLYRPVGKRLPRIVYDLLMDVGDAFQSSIQRFPALEQFEAVGLDLSMQEPFLGFHEQEKAWSQVLSVPVRAARAYANAFTWAEVAIEKSLEVERAIQQMIVTPITSTRVDLQKWFEGVVDTGWLTVEELESAGLLSLENRGIWSASNPQASSENPTVEVCRVKLVDLGMQVTPLMAALAVTIVQDSKQRVGVLLRVYPTGNDSYLPERVFEKF
jgi:phage tail-like protein